MLSGADCPCADLRHNVIDALTADQLDQLRAIGDAILSRLVPRGTMAATYNRYDRER